MFITWALKLLFMQIPYILTVFAVIFLLVSPVSANLNKIAPGSPVFIGEQDVDISSGLNGCHTIAWWKSGTDINSAAPGKSTQIYPINTASPLIYHYNFSRDFFGGFTGTWYCADKAPYYPAFVVVEPQINISVWDLDHNADVTGQSVPVTTNITYRVDTNLYQALLFKNRPNKNTDDSPFTVRLVDPKGNNVPTFYTGSIRDAKTVIMPFDGKPFIDASPYYGKNGNMWDHRARNLQGDIIYPDGTYTFVVSQNLNRMMDDNTTLRDGTVTRTATVTIEKEPFVATVTEAAKPVTTAETLTTPVQTRTSPPQVTATTLPTSEPVAKKTTYSPLPAWVGIGAFVLAGLFLIRKRT